ncbi:DUF6090 family protein [Portibacter marinus]|uniref:DUF6090 family protein n=1 Tax=Portibacter marinus TaxID=2898660 RepID=UPI001F22FC51|nr:DUF6090 family protein [Portibacter marinus]
MIKFFRSIRKSLLNENRTGKYLKYAIGEVLLVVIGILIALQINNWNAGQQQSKKNTKLLRNLVSDIKKDIDGFTKVDSVYAIYESNAEKGLHLFYKANTVKDIDSVMQLSQTSWNELFFTSRTYDEMVNSGSMYTLDNEELQQRISAYYTSIYANQRYIREVNTSQRELFVQSKDMYPVFQLLSEFNDPNIGLKLLDTTWINNPNSSTYLAFSHYLNLSQSDNNQYRRRVFRRLLKQAEALKSKIYEEIGD